MEDKFLGVFLERLHITGGSLVEEHPFRVEAVDTEMKARANTLGSLLKEEGKAVGKPSLSCIWTLSEEKRQGFTSNRVVMGCFFFPQLLFLLKFLGSFKNQKCKKTLDLHFLVLFPQCFPFFIFPEIKLRNVNSEKNNCKTQNQYLIFFFSHWKPLKIPFRPPYILRYDFSKLLSIP